MNNSGIDISFGYIIIIIIMIIIIVIIVIIIVIIVFFYLQVTNALSKLRFNANLLKRVVKKQIVVRSQK